MESNQYTIIHSKFVQNALACLFLYMMVYGYQMLRLGLGGDEMWDLSEPLLGLYVAQGRFPIVLYHALCGCGQMVPWAYGVASAVFYSLAVALQIKILGFAKPVTRFLYIATSLGVAYMSVMMNYANAADVMSLGILLVTIGFRYYQKACEAHAVKFYSLAIILTSFGVCCYQINILVFVALALGVMLGRDLSTRECMTRLCRLAVFALLVCAIQAALKTASIHLMLAFQPDLGHYVSTAMGYQQGLIGWLSSSVEHNVFSSLSVLKKCLLGQYIHGWFYASCIVPVVYLAAKWRREPLRLLMLMALYLLPFTPLVVFAAGITGKTVFFRLAIHASISAAVMWCIALESSGMIDRERVRRFFVALSLVLIVEASYIASNDAFTKKRMYDFGVAKAQQITNEVNYYIHSNPEASPQDLPVVVVGGFPFHGGNTSSEKSGSLFFGGYMFRHTSNPQLGFSTQDKLPETIQRKIADLPAFPAKGAIMKIGDKIYVKCPNPDQMW